MTLRKCYLFLGKDMQISTSGRRLNGWLSDCWLIPSAEGMHYLHLMGCINPQIRCYPGTFTNAVCALNLQSLKVLREKLHLKQQIWIFKMEKSMFRPFSGNKEKP